MRSIVRPITAIALVAVGLATLAQALVAHDLFLRPRDYIVKPGATLDVRVLNGGFSSSVALVDAARLRDLTLRGPGSEVHPDRTSWTGSGTESTWRVAVGSAGTYLLGASLTPRTIRLSGKEFNGYLEEEGLPQVLEARRKAHTQDDSTHERYAKHVKALVRVGDPLGGSTARADTAFRIALGYPAEIIPLTNPYRRDAGQGFAIRALIDGQPVENQFVLYGGVDTRGKRIRERRVRTNDHGVANLSIAQRGTWYVKFIRMLDVPPSPTDSVNYESKWATLTFAIP